MRPLQCKHRSPWKIMETRQCERNAVTDGYCTRHHPDYVPPSQTRAMAAHEAERGKTPREKLLAAIEEAKIKQEAARRAVEVAQDNVTDANWERHKAELALRRLDYPFLDAPVSRS